ncbi:alpha/beta fold hydrolase [Nitrincola sp. A-D6]|uniref:alpha/beta fold hydrolase n=1 Tax=Nitrincola sp. A-D6 TaxID=1545442 RepID=UPI0013631F6C|nr:alpha/beta hydrolase [Nitrincola sp. A-D6]
MNPTQHRFTLPHLQLTGQSWGDKQDEPVIALHGWLDNAASFNWLAPQLSNYYILAPDLAGHGHSDHRPAATPYYIWDNLADLIALADQQGLSRFHLIGHSMGAGIAALLAAVAPERVRSLVLLDGLAPMTTPAEQAPAQMAQAFRQRSRIGTRHINHYKSFEDAVTARMLSRFPVPYAAAQALVERALSPSSAGWKWHTDPCLILPSVLRLTEAQVCEFLKLIKVPVLLCLAQQGIATSQTHKLAACVEALQIQYLPGGHHFHLEEETVEHLAGHILQQLNAAGCGYSEI